MGEAKQWLSHGDQVALQILDTQFSDTLLKRNVYWNLCIGEPVEIVLLLVGPESESDQHIVALSRIGRLLRSEAVRKELVAAESPDAFYEVLREAEKS